MLMKREQEGKAFCSRLSAPLRRYRTRTTGGYVASPSAAPKFAFGKLHISQEHYQKRCAQERQKGRARKP